MFEFLLLDLDDTILDFQKAEHVAIRKTIRDYGVEPTDAVCGLYSRINKAHWEALERKELTREQVLVGRFAELFRTLGVTVEPTACARQYEHNLSQGHWFLPGALEALQSLSKKYQLYLVSNGTAKVQAGRLESAKISPYFREIFVSQELGANKPDPEYFRKVFARIPDFDPKKAIIVGDSLTSDIRGGLNAGIATCWINPRHLPCPEDIRPHYQLEALSQLEDLLKQLEETL